jgi:hypothetical protein
VHGRTLVPVQRVQIDWTSHGLPMRLNDEQQLLLCALPGVAATASSSARSSISSGRAACVCGIVQTAIRREWTSSCVPRGLPASASA